MVVRTIDIILIAALLGGVAWTFKVKNDSEDALARMAALERKIAHEREVIDLLRADWSLLTSPERLERLVERYNDALGLIEARPQQFVTLSDVPEKSPLIQFETLTAQERQAAVSPLDAWLVTGSTSHGIPRRSDIVEEEGKRVR
jgi:hypothetical protein